MNKTNNRPPKLSKETFVIDTNILIKFSIWAPPNIHIIFWEQMKKAVADKRIIIIEEVANECTRGFIKYWIKERKDAGQIVTVENDIKNRAAQINDEYKMISIGDDGNLKSTADPVIIAYAESNGYIVFTDESAGQIQPGQTVATIIESGEEPKIPFVCDNLKVIWTRSPKKVLIKIMKPIKEPIE